MIEAFYAMVAIFSLNEIYHAFNRKRLDLLFKNKEPENMRKMDILYYLIRVLSAVWPLIGLFSSAWALFLCLIFASVLKFALYHIEERYYRAYSIIAYPIISIAVYIAIFCVKFIR
jgi:hypothetical protein